MPLSPNYRLGLACLFLATFCTSTAGVLLRWLDDAEGWRVLFWRSLFFVGTLTVWLSVVHRGGVGLAFRRLGWRGLEVSLFFAVATVSFVFALLETTVARVVIINSMVPFVTALLGRLLLGERVRPVTWAAMAVASLGIVIMVQDGWGSGGSLLGDLLAALTCLVASAMFVALRRHPEVDKVPAILVAGLLVATVSLILAPRIDVSAHDLGLMAALGCIQLGLQYLLISYASRSVPAAEIALIGRMTIVLAPLWVWLGAGEVPRNATLWGGAVILLAVGGQGLLGLRRRAAITTQPVS